MLHCVPLGLTGSSPLVPIPCISSLYSRNSLRQTTKGPTKWVLVIRICLLYVCVHYYSKPNRGRKLVCVKRRFVFKFVLMTFLLCMYLYPGWGVDQRKNCAYIRSNPQPGYKYSYILPRCAAADITIACMHVCGNVGEVFNDHINVLSLTSNYCIGVEFYIAIIVWMSSLANFVPTQCSNWVGRWCELSSGAFMPNIVSYYKQWWPSHCLQLNYLVNHYTYSRHIIVCEI